MTFNNQRSYLKAVSAAFVEIKTTKFTKKVSGPVCTLPLGHLRGAWPVTTRAGLGLKLCLCWVFPGEGAKLCLEVGLVLAQERGSGLLSLLGMWGVFPCCGT